MLRAFNSTASISLWASMGKALSILVFTCRQMVADGEFMREFFVDWTCEKSVEEESGEVPVFATQPESCQRVGPRLKSFRRLGLWLYRPKELSCIYGKT